MHSLKVNLCIYHFLRCCAPGDLCYRKVPSLTLFSAKFMGDLSDVCTLDSDQDAHYAQCQPEGHCSEHAGWKLVATVGAKSPDLGNPRS